MTVNLLQRAAIGTMRLAPRSLIWRFSQRYIAGTHLTDAYDTVAELNAEGCGATIDVLGEDSTNAGEVTAAQRLYLDALDGIAKRSLACGVSVKLSGMGLRFDPGGCKRAMRKLLKRAASNGRFVRIDMEDSSVTTPTLDTYRELRTEFQNVGAVIQACLRRSEADVADLLQGGRTDIRVCKGIYVEPESIALLDANEIRESYKRIVTRLLEGGAARVGIATHDPELVEHARQAISRLAVPVERYEFQMLLGVAEPLRRQLVAEGFPVRVYVPFGELWFAYSLRRLRENPNIAGHIMRNLMRPR